MLTVQHIRRMKLDMRNISNIHEQKQHSDLISRCGSSFVSGAKHLTIYTDLNTVESLLNL